MRNTNRRGARAVAAGALARRLRGGARKTRKTAKAGAGAQRARRSAASGRTVLRVAKRLPNNEVQFASLTRSRRAHTAKRVRRAKAAAGSKAIRARRNPRKARPVLRAVASERMQQAA